MDYLEMQANPPGASLIYRIIIPLNLDRAEIPLREVGLAATDVDIDLSCPLYQIPILIDQAQLFRRENEAHLLAFSLRQMDALESFECALRNAGLSVLRMDDVELHDLVAGTPSQSL